jgi:Tol biopolymer transport system component
MNPPASDAPFDRGVRRNRSAGPVLVFALVVAFFVVGVWVLVTGRRDPDVSQEEVSPSTDASEHPDEGVAGQPTGTTRVGADGSVMFDVSQGATSQVFVVDLATGNRKGVATELTNPSQPTSDELGEAVAVVAEGGEGPGIYLRRSEDETFLRLPLPEHSTSPALSRDGSLLAFVSDEAGQDDIYIADVSTLRVTVVANSSSDEFDPAWETGGERLVFVRHGSEADVVVVALSDGTVEGTVHTPGIKTSPSIMKISTDGRTLVSYVGDRGGTRDPQVVDLTTGEVVQTFPTAGIDLGLAAADAALLVSVLDRSLVRIDSEGDQMEISGTMGAMHPHWLPSDQ